VIRDEGIMRKLVCPNFLSTVGFWNFAPRKQKTSNSAEFKALIVGFDR
jgi:hypothetical protein